MRKPSTGSDGTLLTKPFTRNTFLRVSLKLSWNVLPPLAFRSSGMASPPALSGHTGGLDRATPSPLTFLCYVWSSYLRLSPRKSPPEPGKLSALVGKDPPFPFVLRRRLIALRPCYSLAGRPHQATARSLLQPFRPESQHGKDQDVLLQEHPDT